MDDYRLYNRMVDLSSDEIPVREAVKILGLNQEEREKYASMLEHVKEERLRFPEFPGFAHVDEDGNFYDAGYDLD